VFGIDFDGTTKNRKQTTWLIELNGKMSGLKNKESTKKM
jgi:hypothetical protein